GHFTELHPLPDPAQWQALQGEARVRRGLLELYEYFARTEDMMAAVFRDAEVHSLTREIMELRRGGRVAEIGASLAECVPRTKRGRAALALATDFRAWRRLRQ